MNAAIRTFGAALSGLHAELDWARLGRSYCEGEGSGFFDEELRARILDTGLLLADDVARELPGDGPRRSLYLGAAVAELAPLLAESLVLGREVRWVNLACDETDELARALRTVGARVGVALPLPETTGIEAIAPGGCDHLWMVSVLTDPDAFPALHDELYERSGGTQATGRGSLAEERPRALALVQELLRRAAGECLLTTTDEELQVVRPALEPLRRSLRVSRSSRLSAVVGDAVRSCRIGSA